MTTRQRDANTSRLEAKTRIQKRWFVWTGVVIVSLAIALWIGSWWGPRQDPRALWTEAQGELQKGNIAAAESKLAMILQSRAPTSLDHCLEAQIAVARGNPADALTALAQVPLNDPAAAQAQLLIGRIQRQKNLTAPAEAAFRKAIECDPGLIDAHRELIYLLGMQLRRKEVNQEFKSLYQLTPLTHHELYTWGLSHFYFLQSVGARDTADHLEAFVMADPKDRHSRVALVSLLVKSPGMEQRVEQLLEPLPPNDSTAIAYRIELKLEHGDTDGAREILRNAPDRDPQLSRIRGRLALLSGDHQAAISHFRAALSDEIYDRVSIAELGRLLALTGDKSAAETYLAQAKRLDHLYSLLNRIRRPDRENEPADLLKLGLACEAAGLTEEAQGWCQLAISRDPLDSEAQKVIHRLKQGRPSPTGASARRAGKDQGSIGLEGYDRVRESR